MTAGCREVYLPILTPIGPGIIESTWMLDDRQRFLVRIRMTPENRAHVDDPNCMIPDPARSRLFNLFVFDAIDLSTHGERPEDIA